VRNFYVGRQAARQLASAPEPRHICAFGPVPEEGAGLCAMIKVEGLTKKYAGITAVNDLNFTV
jgi:hypothetical protein